MRKADLPFPCGDCNKTFPSVAAREMHRKAKHKVRIHSLGDLKSAIESGPNAQAAYRMAANRASGSRRWRLTGGKGFWVVVLGSTLFLALLASVAVLAGLQ